MLRRLKKNHYNVEVLLILTFLNIGYINIISLSKLKPFIKSEIISYETEKNIEGKFLDILAKDQEGRKIAIENQFGISNFDHLGKVISYCTSIKADKGVWIAEKFHPIHIEALHWLNNVNSSIEFIVISVINPMTNQAGDRNKIEFKEPILYNEVNIGDILDARNRNKVEIDDTLKKVIELYNDEFPRSRAVRAGLITGQFIFWLFKRDEKIYQQYFKE